MPVRVDIGTLRPAQRMSDGRLRAEAHISRVGVFEYEDSNGRVRRELRRPRDVFSQDSLESFALVPVTNDHPPEPVTAMNARRYMVGSLGEKVLRDDDHLRATLMVADAQTIAEMEAGKVEVSCGYLCDVIDEPGVDPVFGPYDAVQTNIRGNHVAIVKTGRAGPTARIRMDGAAVMVAAPPVRRDSRETHQPLPGAHVPPENNTTSPLTIEAAAQQVALAEQRAHAAEAKLAAEMKRADEAQGRADSLQTKVAQLEANRVDEKTIALKDAQIADLQTRLAAAEQKRVDAEDPKRFRAAVLERANVSKIAGMIMGENFVTDSMTNREIQVAVVERLHGVDCSVNPETKQPNSDDYVRARFDAAVESFNKGGEALNRLRAVAAIDAQQPKTDSINAREKAIQQQQDAWKQPLPSSKQKGL